MSDVYQTMLNLIVVGHIRASCDYGRYEAESNQPVSGLVSLGLTRYAGTARANRIATLARFELDRVFHAEPQRRMGRQGIVGII
jgi:hypothetical protein